jgi:hypothetical protein
MMKPSFPEKKRKIKKIKENQRKSKKKGEANGRKACLTLAVTSQCRIRGTRILKTVHRADFNRERRLRAMRAQSSGALAWKCFHISYPSGHPSGSKPYLPLLPLLGLQRLCALRRRCRWYNRAPRDLLQR